LFFLPTVAGIYVDDAEFMASSGADPSDKGGSVGNKWLVLPLPHRLDTGPGWRVEQGIMSSFQRTSRNANIPLQLNFTAISEHETFIEITKGTPLLQYVKTLLLSLVQISHGSRVCGHGCHNVALLWP
jgi:hypothetical protein